MQVNIEDKSTVKKNIHFEIPSEDVAKELDKAYKELKKTASIKGFRKGKIPRTVLESRFSKDIHSDVGPRMIQNAFVEVVQENKLDVLGTPSFSPEKPELEPGKDFVFDVEIEVRPEIEDVEFKGLELKKPLYRVTDEEIDAQLQMIRKNLSTKEPVKEERPVKESDFVLIDYEGFVDGAPFDATPKVENYVMAIGSKAVPEQFSTKMTGAIPQQDLEIEVVYPEDESNEELAGKTVLYKLLLKEIQEEILPALDDALAEKLGKFKSLDELKETITDNLQQGIKTRVNQELSEQVFATLLEKNEFEVPNALVESELEGIVAETEQNFMQNNVTLDQLGITRDSIKEKYRDVAEKQARRHVILGKVIDQEGIDLSDEDLATAYQAMATAMGATVDAVQNLFKQDPRQFEYFKYYELEKKAIALIIESGNVTEFEPETETPQDADANVEDAAVEETQDA